MYHELFIHEFLKLSKKTLKPDVFIVWVILTDYGQFQKLFTGLLNHLFYVIFIIYFYVYFDIFISL